MEILNPIIAAVREERSLSQSLSSPAQIIFLLGCDVNGVGEAIQKIKQQKKEAFVHADFVKGLDCDFHGIRFLAKQGADGIISTRSGSIKSAKENGLKTVQRFFVVDSLSLATLQESVKQSKPDFVELMPGILADMIGAICHKIQIPIIAGGLVTTKNQVMAALKAGAVAVSTGKEELWYA